MVRGTIAGLVFAGHETTKNQLGWMIASLAGVPALWNEVGKDPAKARPVVEEVLRFRSAASINLVDNRSWRLALEFSEVRVNLHFGAALCRGAQERDSFEF